MARAKTKVAEIQADLLANLAVVRDALVTGRRGPDVDDAFAHVETFCAIGVRVIAQTNPSKVRDVAMVVEIASLQTIPPTF